VPLVIVLIAVFGASTQLTGTDWVVLIIGSLCYLSSYLFAYRGYSSAPLSVVAPIAYTAPAIATVLTVLFLGAKLTLLQGLPLVAIMAGVILLSTKFSELRNSTGVRGRSLVTSGVALGIGAAVSFSFVFVALSAVVPEVGYLVPVLVLKAGGGLSGIAFSPVFRRDIRPSRNSLSVLMLAVAFFDTVAYLFLGAGIVSAGGFLPLVIMTSGMGGFFLVCYGILLRKEKPEPNQLLGIAVSIAGVAALLYLTA
jgi:drug/metabolite transporter (DMT)-like permease